MTATRTVPRTPRERARFAFFELGVRAVLERDGSYSIPFSFSGRTGHRIAPNGERCSCPAGQHGRPCWATHLLGLMREYVGGGYQESVSDPCPWLAS